MQQVKPGITGHAAMTVQASDTASVQLSGALDVFATPRLVSLMEQAACDAIDRYLDTGETSVGTRIDVSHTSATPVGMRVWADATLTAHEARTLCFQIEAFDECGSIGRAEHERFLVQSDRFMKKAESKRL